MMEAASTSETSVNLYQTTRRNNPEDSHLHTHRRENLKSHLDEFSLLILTTRLMALSYTDIGRTHKHGDHPIRKFDYYHLL
jgi:hypothetical protein